MAELDPLGCSSRMKPSVQRASLGAFVVAAALLASRRAGGQGPPPAPAPSVPAPVTPPKLSSEPSVAYPEGASGDATVVLTLTINADGTVRQATAIQSNEPFSSQAASAALGWRFEPALRNGVPVATKIRFEVVFHAPVETETDEASSAGLAAGESKTSPPAPRAEKAQEVLVRGVRPEPSRTASLSRAEVRQIPGTFGDPFRAVEVMPGVTPILSGLPFFFVRGAPPGDVGYFLDGIRVPLLFHVGVGPSVLHPGLIERVDLYPGGYPARFGRFSGGIVSGETTQPLPQVHGEYNVRLVDAGAMAEIPFANGRGTLLAGGRYSYTATLLTLLAAGVELDYWDYQARATYDVTPDDRLGVFAFGSYDYLGQITPTQTLTLFGAEFHRVDLRYDRRLGEHGNVRLAATAGIDRSRLPDDRFLRNRMTGLRSEITYHLSPKILFRGGTDVEIDHYDVELNVAQLGPVASGAASLFPTRTDLAMGGRADVVIEAQPGFEVTPGVRLDFFGSEGAAALAVDPRLSTRVAVSQHLRLLSALGVAHQPPAFIVPVPGFQPGGLHGGLQRALQESMGLEFELDESTQATVTVFHNAFFNMSDPLGSRRRQLGGCPPGTFPVDSIAGDRGSQPTGNASNCRPRFTSGTIGPDNSGGGEGAPGTVATILETRTLGSSYGFEFFFKRKLTSRLGGFLSYTLSRSIRSVGRDDFVATFDRTHVANAALAFNLGRNWRAGTRAVFYTGLPKAIDPTDPGATRLPPFFRLDLRLEKRWQLGEKTWISVVGEWMNATLSKEALSTTCTLRGCETQTIGPVTIPSLGVEGGF